MSLDQTQPTPTHTPRPTATPLPALKYDRALLLFGPNSGSLNHNTRNNTLEIVQTTAVRQDALVEGVFLNPQLVDGNQWQHGFLLKSGGFNRQYWVSIDSEGELVFFHRLGKPEAIDWRGTFTPDIDRTEGGKNLLQVAMVGDTGYVYVNSKFQATISMNSDTGGSRVTVFTDDESSGTTRYKDLAIWQWTPEVAEGFPETALGAQATVQVAAEDAHNPPFAFSRLRDDRDLREQVPDRDRLIRDLPWIKDGLVASERQAAQGLVDLALHGGDYFQEFVKQEWVAAGQNLPAVESMGRMARNFPEEFKAVTADPDIRDGITPEETKMVAVLRDVANNNPDLLPTVLSKYSLEERTIELPLAGQVQLTIVRTQPGSAATMNLLEAAVRVAEDWMDTPLLRREVVYLFEDAVIPGAGGHNSWTAIVIKPSLDREDRDPLEVGLLLAHEVAHYYWNSGERWIREGGANFIEAVYGNSVTGWPLHPQSGQCPYFDSIADLEALDPESLEVPEFSCNYSLGERLFHDLYRVLGEQTFSEGFRQLFYLSLRDDPNDDCPGTHLNVCHVEAAFERAAGDSAGEVERVIQCWYHGEKASCPPSAPADPRTPLLGPLSGSIPHLPDNGFLELSQEFPLSGDFMLEATFENPYAPRESHWVYGIFIRGENGNHRLFVNSWRAWRHAYYHTEKERHGGARADSAPSVDVSANGENHLRLIRIGDTGWLYVNNRFAGYVPFDLGGIGPTKQVSLMINDSGKGLKYKVGDNTAFRDLTIWQWDPILFELPEED